MKFFCFFFSLFVELENGFNLVFFLTNSFLSVFPAYQHIQKTDHELPHQYMCLFCTRCSTGCPGPKAGESPCSPVTQSKGEVTMCILLYSWRVRDAQWKEQSLIQPGEVRGASWKGRPMSCVWQDKGFHCGENVGKGRAFQQGGTAYARVWGRNNMGF